MREPEVLEMAEWAARTAGHPWLAPFSVSREKRFLLFGPVTWCVRSNSANRGASVNVRIDEAAGRVKSVSFAQG